MIVAKNGQIQNVTIVGTGVIGASWAAYYLSRGLNVIATDPAPNAEDDATPPGAILASSSSGITMDVIQSACKRPERSVIGFRQQTFGMTAND